MDEKEQRRSTDRGTSAHTATDRVMIVGGARHERLHRAFLRTGARAEIVALEDALMRLDDTVEAVIIGAPRDAALALCARLKTRFQLPVLPVIVLVRRRARDAATPTAPDAWLPPRTTAGDVVARVLELVRIRRAEHEMARLNTALAELASENARLYDRARRDAEATTLLLRELQHRVRNNLASIQALLVLERHRAPPRPLPEALDVAIARLRSMAALQDALSPSGNQVDVAALASSVARSALEVFGSANIVRCDVTGAASVPGRVGSALAIVLNELVTNTVKHAGARSLLITVERRDDLVELNVSDDGRGPAAHPSGGSGLSIVRTVVQNELRGEFRITPANPGTRVSVTVPVADASPADVPRAPHESTPHR
jgi:two-component sensor histidine kinase